MIEAAKAVESNAALVAAGSSQQRAAEGRRVWLRNVAKDAESAEFASEACNAETQQEVIVRNSKALSWD